MISTSLRKLYQIAKNDFLLQKFEASQRESLLKYFGALSETTRRRFAPHPFDRSFIENHICNEPESEGKLRIILMEKSSEQIVSYFILDFNLIKHEIMRYRE